MVKVLRSLVRGPLEPYIVGFAEELLRRGYSRTSAEQHVCFLAHLDRWMQGEGIGLEDLTGPVTDRYLSQRRAAGYAEYRSMKALQPLLNYLAPLGVLPDPEQVPPSPVEELLVRYRCWLLEERGLTAGTARGYIDCVRPFVATRMHGDALDLAGVTAGDVIRFVTRACPGRAVGTAELPPVPRTPGVRWPAASRKDVVYACPTPCGVPVAGRRVGPYRGQTGRTVGQGIADFGVVPAELDGAGRRG
jgi:integrase/recombinase XerD